MEQIKIRALGKKPFRSDAALTLIIFCLTLSIFLLSRVHQVADSQYSMILSESFLYHRSFSLNHYAIPRYEPTWAGYYFKNGAIYQLEWVGPHLYYHFPPGTPVLSAPFVAILNLFGVSAVKDDGTYNPRGEVIIEAGLAALLMAALAGVWFQTARLALPRSWSFLVALGGALGTQVYSTASRALWSETWGIFLLGFVIFLLFAHELGKRRLNLVLLASLLAWTYFVRPTFAVPIAAITIYLFFFHRSMFVPYVLTGIAWLAGFILYSWTIYGSLLPTYYRASRLGFEHFSEALAGNIVSPARGLLVYVPILLFVIYLLMRYRSFNQHRRLVWLALAVIVIHLFLISSFGHWWGGHSFGPRFSTGLVPWFVLLGILGVRAMLNWRAAQANQGRAVRWWQAQGVVGGVLLVASMFINTLGATSHATWLWNQRPRDIDAHPERLWDWRQPQFLAKYLPYPRPDYFPTLESRTDFSRPESSKYLWYGWTPTADGVWADNDAALVFSLAAQEPAVLRLNLSAFLVPGKLDVQPVTVSLNQKALTTFIIKETAPRIYELTLPADLLRSENVLRFQMPNAQSPQRLGAGDDPRWRSLNLHSIEMETATIEK